MEKEQLKEGWTEEENKFVVFFRGKDGKYLGSRECVRVHINLKQLKEEVEDIIIIPIDEVKDFEKPFRA